MPPAFFFLRAAADENESSLSPSSSSVSTSEADASSLSEELTPDALVSEPLSSSSLRAALRAFFWLTRAAAREGRPLAVALELPG